MTILVTFKTLYTFHILFRRLVYWFTLKILCGLGIRGLGIRFGVALIWASGLLLGFGSEPAVIGNFKRALYIFYWLISLCKEIHTLGMDVPGSLYVSLQSRMESRYCLVSILLYLTMKNKVIKLSHIFLDRHAILAKSARCVRDDSLMWLEGIFPWA